MFLNKSDPERVPSYSTIWAEALKFTVLRFTICIGLQNISPNKTKINKTIIEN